MTEIAPPGRTGPVRGRLWAVTTYYNPVGYRRRRANYDVFRRHLGLPLLTMELVWGAAPELGEGDAEILVQLGGGDVMWQKERLLNLAVSRLPPECDRFAWIDCDIVFCDQDSAERLDRLLDTFLLVQAFDRVRHVTPEWRPGVPVETMTDFVAPSAIGTIRDGGAPAEVFGASLIERRKLSMGGFAWAARRELIERCPLYDAAIAGGGDRLAAGAAYGLTEVMAAHHLMRGPRREHFLAWAERWRSAVGGADAIGALHGEILHLWHGDLADRRGVERLEGLDALGYDPFNDIALDDRGVWRWSSDKPRLHGFVRDYLVGRREDG